MKLITLISITTLLCVIHVVSGQSQIPMVGSEGILDKLRLNKGINGIETVPYSNINGDPYIYKDFEKGKLTVITGEKYDVNVRYDIYANQVHLKTDNVIYAIIHPEKVSLIEAGNLKFIYSDYKKSAGEVITDGSSYFIVKADGKCKLLIKKNIRIQDAEPAKLYQEAKPAKFILTEDTYYLKPGDKSAVRIKSKSDILDVLSDKKEALDSFITSNKTGVKKIEDLEKIVSHYNGL